MTKKIKVLMAKVGWDVHDIGAKFVTKTLRDDGMEVVYTGVRNTMDEVVASAIQEDVDVIGISIIQGNPVGIVTKLMAKLREEKIQDEFMVLVGGLIPSEDIPKLKEMGVAEVFLPTSQWEEFPAFIRQNLPQTSTA